MNAEAGNHKREAHQGAGVTLRRGNSGRTLLYCHCSQPYKYLSTKFSDNIERMRTHLNALITVVRRHNSVMCKDKVDAIAGSPALEM